MAPKLEQREKVEAALGAHLLATGLSQTGLRALARAAGVSDRMLLYYFVDKAEALSCATSRVAANLAALVSEAIPAGQRLPPLALMREAAALTTRPDVRPYMRLWVEIVAAAAREEAPYPLVAAQTMAGFMTWALDRLDLDPSEDREAAAAMVIATIDGIALVDICGGPELAIRAAASIRPG